MKPILYTLFICLFSFSIAYLHGQSHMRSEKMGFEKQIEALSQMQKPKKKGAQLKNLEDIGQTLYIKTQFHQLRTSDGQGGFDEEEFEAIKAALNLIFEQAGIQFVFCNELDNIDDDMLYSVGWRFSLNDQDYVPNLNHSANVLDLYIDAIPSEAFGFAGLSTVNVQISTGHLTVGAANSNGEIGNEPEEINAADNIPAVASLAHEIGHVLGLEHTFAPNGSPAEKASGSNCSVTADLLCDTPADPRFPSNGIVSGESFNYFNTSDCQFLMGGNLAYVNEFLETDIQYPNDPVNMENLNEEQLAFYTIWLSTWEEENGNFHPFDPPITNFMSYYTESCQSTFSPQQISQMRHTLCQVKPELQYPIEIVEAQDVHLNNDENSPPILFLIQNESLHYSDFTISGSHNIAFHNCDIVFDRDLIIPEGAMVFFYNSNVMMSGGEILCDGGTLLGQYSEFQPYELLCHENHLWSGIRVSGQPDIMDPVGDVALIDCQVRNAEIGVQLGTGSTNGLANTYPGVSHLVRTDFIDNEMDVFIDGNPNMDSHEESQLMTNSIIFESCRFTDTQQSQSGENSISFLMKGMNNIEIRNSEFSDNSSTKIQSIGASFSLLGAYDEWPNYTPLGESIIQGGDGFQINITGQGDEPILIADYTFSTQIGAGNIIIDNAASLGVLIQRNSFVTHLYDQQVISANGIRIENESNFTIEDNSFSIHSDGGSAIHIVNTGSQTNQILNNDFTTTLLPNQLSAVQIEGMNGESQGTHSTGTELSCNLFEGFWNGITIDGTDVNDGIDPFQGSSISPVNNTFVSIENLDIQNNSPSPFRYYEYNSLQNGALNVLNVQILYTSTDNPSCPSISPKSAAIENIDHDYNILMAYPNPTQDLLLLRVNLPVRDELRLTGAMNLYNIQMRSSTGQIVLELPGLRPTSEALELDISHLPHGLYTLHLSYDKASLVKRIVVQ